MTWEELNILQRLRLLNECPQHVIRYPILPAYDTADGQEQFRLPRLVQFYEAVDAAIEELDFVEMIVLCRRKKREKLLAGE